jgi:hypothetical protein
VPDIAPAWWPRLLSATAEAGSPSFVVIGAATDPTPQRAIAQFDPPLSATQLATAIVGRKYPDWVAAAGLAHANCVIGVGLDGAAWVAAVGKEPKQLSVGDLSQDLAPWVGILRHVTAGSSGLGYPDLAKYLSELARLSADPGAGLTLEAALREGREPEAGWAGALDAFVAATNDQKLATVLELLRFRNDNELTAWLLVAATTQ